MKFNKLSWLYLILGVFLPSLALAQQTVLQVELKPNGNEKTASLTAAHAGLKAVHFYTIARGNMTSPLRVTLAGPPGLSAEVDAIAAKKNVAQALAAKNGWYKIKMSKRLVTRSGSATQQQTAPAFDCSWLTDAIYRQLLAYFRMIGQNPSRQEICEMFSGGGGSPGGTPTPSPGDPGTPGSDSAYADGLLERDSCGTGKDAAYIVRLKVDLSKINTALFQTGFEVAASINVKPWKGRTDTLLKPESDGGIFKGPIILMTTTGGLYYGGEKIRVVRWARKKPKLLRQFKVDPRRNYVVYRGKIYTRVPVGSVLRGGRATFALQGAHAAYSVCLRLQPVRQQINWRP